MRFLVRVAPAESDRTAALSEVRSIATNLGGRVVNPKWTSRGELEVDIFIASRADLEVVLAALEPLTSLVFVRDLQEPTRFLPKDRVIQESIGLFNAERYWEAHEVLEALWRVSQGDEKRLLQGLILVCATLVHHQKGNDDVALGVARRALPLLEWRSGSYLGLDVAVVVKRMKRMVEDGSITVFELSRRREG
jgi:uncharacterized protein